MYLHLFDKFDVSYIHINKLKYQKFCIIFMPGTRGLTEPNILYVKFLASLGYTVISPERNQKQCHVGVCCGDIQFSSKKRICSKGLLSKKHNDVIAYRSKQIQLILKKCNKVILVGSSEGAIVVSVYPQINKIVAKIILSYSLENNYFVHKLHPISHKCNVLNIIGDKDEYFGRTGSIASYCSKVGVFRFLGGIEGNGKRNCGCCKIIVLKNSKHNILEKYKNYVFGLIQDFIEDSLLNV